MHLHKFLDPVKNFFLEFLPTYCEAVMVTTMYRSILPDTLLLLEYEVRGEYWIYCKTDL